MPARRSDSHLPSHLRSLLLRVTLAAIVMVATTAPATARGSTWGGIKALYGGTEGPRSGHPVLESIRTGCPDFPGWGGEVTIARYDFGTIVTGPGKDGREWGFALRDGEVVLAGDSDFWERVRRRLQRTACAGLGAAATAKCAVLTAGFGSVGCIVLGALVAELCMETFFQLEQLDDVPDTMRVSPPDSTGRWKGGAR